MINIKKILKLNNKVINYNVNFIRVNHLLFVTSSSNSKTTLLKSFISLPSFSLNSLILVEKWPLLTLKN